MASSADKLRNVPLNDLDEDSVDSRDGDEGDNITFGERLNSIPTYTATKSQIQSLYDGVKERNDTWASAFSTGEGYFQTLLNVASYATQVGLSVAKPVVGEDPVGKIDSMASEVLGKVQERFPMVNYPPEQIASSTVENIHERKEAIVGSVVGSVVQRKDAIVGNVVERKEALVTGVAESETACKVVDTCQRAISASELMVEFCFPTDGSNYDDILELERAEEDEDKGVVTRATNLKDRVKRRGTKKLMSYQVVQKSVDFVQYAQDKMFEMNDKLHKGTNYAVGEIKNNVQEGANMIELTREHVDMMGSLNDMTSAAVSHVTGVTNNAVNQVAQARAVGTHMAESVVNKGIQVIDKSVEGFAQVSESGVVQGVWNQVYTASMYIPKKAIQVTGEVLISSVEVVFAFTKAHRVTEMPLAIVDMADEYYRNLKTEQPMVIQLEEKVMAFVVVPTQAVSKQVLSNKKIQWILPNIVRPDQIQMVQDGAGQHQRMGLPPKPL